MSCPRAAPTFSNSEPLTTRVALMVFSGQYDVTCKRKWSAELEHLCAEPYVIIDLSNVSYLDATCVTELLRMHARRSGKGFDREIVILGQPSVRRVFELLSMQSVVRIVERLKDVTLPEGSSTTVYRAFCGDTRVASS